VVTKYSEAVRELLEDELECPHCHATNVPGNGGKHIHIDEYGLAVCGCCGGDWKPEISR
jgi:transcription elongation factor Elf1